MPTPTYTPLATVTLGSSAASVTFSSIPATYRDLIVVFKGAQNASSTSIQMRFNGDSASNYTYVYMSSAGDPNPTSGSGSFTGIAPGAFGTTQTNVLYQVMDYSATDKHKTVLTRLDDQPQQTSAWAGRWANTAAITSVAIVSGNQFVSGTTVSMYGVIA
jgi:hypothetical protein